MITRVGANLGLRTDPVPEATTHLHREGWAVLRGAFDDELVDRLRTDLLRLFDGPPDQRSGPGGPDQFRHNVVARSAVAREVLARREILDVVEPLLGEDCHVICAPAWRIPPVGFTGQPWHTDAGPHLPRPAGVPWDDRIPYPVFVVAAHVLVEELTVADGATAVVPGTHRSGQGVPFDRMFDETIDHGGVEPVLLTGAPGDVILFCSDIWHRGLPSSDGATGRFFLQSHYARRDVAQRLELTRDVNHLPAEVAASLEGREATLLGLHPPFFYDG